MSFFAEVSLIISAFRTQNTRSLTELQAVKLDSFGVEFAKKENHHETFAQDLLRNFTPHRPYVNAHFGRHPLATSDVYPWVQEMLGLVGCWR
jgi:hypothetical protein